MRAVLASSACPEQCPEPRSPRRPAVRRRRARLLLAVAAACVAVLPTTAAAAADAAPGDPWQLVAGTGIKGFSGDGQAAVDARLNYPKAIATGPDGALFVADTLNGRIRKVADGVITTVAGNGTRSFSGDGGPAVEAGLNLPRSIAVAADGVLYIADTDNQRIRRVAVDGTITTVAGTGRWGFGGDGGPAVAAALAGPQGIAVRPDGTLVIADTRNERIREVSPDGVIRTVAGFGRSGYTGDGGPARKAMLSFPRAVTVGPDGSVYLSDARNDVVRRISPAGVITTVAGNGRRGYAGDGGPARTARLWFPAGLAVDANFLYIADASNNRVRSVSLTTGTIYTVLGPAGWGILPRRSSWVALEPQGVAISGSGRLLVADTGHHRIAGRDH